MRVAGPREEAVSLVRNLEHSRRFRTPRIVGETAQAQNPNGRPNPNFEPVNTAGGVNFDVLAEYNPLEPREAKPAAAQKKDTTHVAAAREGHAGTHAHKPTPELKTP
jgi:type IV pilus assembly protein PilN